MDTINNRILARMRGMPAKCDPFGKFDPTNPQRAEANENDVPLLCCECDGTGTVEEGGPCPACDGTGDA